MAERPRRRRWSWWWALAAAVVAAAGCGPSEDPPDEASRTTTSTTASARPSNDEPTFVDGRFTSPEGGFSVELPKHPEEVRQEETVGDVTLDVVLYDVSVSDTEAYQVGFVEYPESLGGLDPPKVLDGAVQGAVTRTRGSLERRSDATLAGAPAMDAEIGAALPIFVRVALSGRRLYTVQQIGPAERTPAYDRILESFRLEE